MQASDADNTRGDLRGYADSHGDKRLTKARKIEHLAGPVAGKRILDLGAGSGILSAYFAQRGAHVTPADRDTAPFQPDLPIVAITGSDLPFDDASFDLVVFNHVIEHVGERAAQSHILGEIVRVLRPGGQLYIAVPNKYALIEPHFNLPLLGALPRSLADAMVRKWRDHTQYDCYPLSYREFLSLVRSHFAKVEDKAPEAFVWAVHHEMGATPLRMVPARAARLMSPIYPTLIALATKV